MHCVHFPPDCLTVEDATVAVPKGKVHCAAFHNAETGPLTNRWPITDVYACPVRVHEVKILYKIRDMDW